MNDKRVIMTDVSTTKAAGLAKVSIRKIQRMIKSGEISATRNTKGSWRIDLSELSRVFDIKVGDLDERQNATNSEKCHDDSVKKANKENLASLRQEIEFLRSQIRTKDEQISSQTKEKEELMKILKQSNNLLENHSKIQEKKKGFFAKILS